MTARQASCFVFLSCLILATAAQAQVTNTAGPQAQPTPGAGHDYIHMLNETVNPANGALSVRIGVPTPSARGLSVPFSFGYDSNAAHHFLAPISPGPADNQSYLAKGGWSYEIAQLNMIQKDNTWSTLSPHQNYDCYYLTDYMLTDLGGQAHAIGISPAQSHTFANCVGIGNPPVTGVSPTDHLSGSGDQFQAITSTIPYSYTTPPPVTAADQDGTVYYFSNSITGAHWTTNTSTWSSLPAWIEDRNGNKVSFTDSGNGNFSVTDTLGRTAISSSGFGTTGNTITVSGMSNSYTVTWGSASSNWSYVAQVTHDPVDSGQCIGQPPTYQVTLPEVTAIGLPNGKSYQLQYDSTSGLLNKIIYPTGGYVRYIWGKNSLSDYITYLDTLHAPACHMKHDTQAITDRYVSFDGATEVLHQHFAYTTTWVPDPNFPTGQMWTQKSTTVTTYDLVRGTNFNIVYNYVPMGVLPQWNDPIIYSQNAIPSESTISYYDTSGALLQTITKNFVGGPNVPPDEKVTLAVTNQVSQTTHAYGSCSASTPCGGGVSPLLTDEYSYDFGSGAPGNLLRHTHTDYASFPATVTFPSSPSILDRPSDVITYDGSGTRVAETDYSYDQTVLGAVSATGHDDTNYPANYTTRGNATTKTVQCIGCTNSTTTLAYDQTGQVVSVTDPCGNSGCSDMSGTSHTTSYSYTDNYVAGSGTPPGATNAYVTMITSPTVNAVTQHQYFQYSYSDGQLTQQKDDNQNAAGIAMNYLYNDSLRRLTETDSADGGITRLVYNDTAPNPTVTTCKLINGAAGAACSATTPPAGWLVTLASMDGLGHIKQTQVPSDPDGTDITDLTYDGMGLVRTKSNPHRASASSTDGTTTYNYDSLGRTTNISEPDGSAVTTSYSGSQTTTTDEAGNQRKSQIDGLGRLTNVWEAPNAAGYNFESDYKYNSLSNLICAVQKGTDTTAFSDCSTSPATWRPRSFVYDSLSRLTSATNPESGTITYAYDANGNISSKISPKPNAGSTGTVTTNYSYDVLNRLLQKTYVGVSTTIAKYAYDGASLSCPGTGPLAISSPTNLIGRKSSMCSLQSATTFSYDPMGRTLIKRTNQAANISKYTYFSYNSDGSLKTLTYPSGDVVTYTPNGAGRTSNVTDASNNYVAPPATPPMYSPGGLLIGMKNGAAITSANAYNTRLQPVTLSAGTTAATLISLSYNFHSGSGDNGNVFQIVNNLDSTHSTQFQYDALNRIQQANTVTTTGANCWGEVYTIDPWGNLTNRAGVTGMSGCATEPLNAAPASTNNQLTGANHDPAGNVVNDGLGNTPTYDGENRIVTDAGVTYSYDADGNRMEKSSGTLYWYGEGSDVLSESNLSGTINSEYIFYYGNRVARVDRPSGTVHYYFADHLGSASVITDAVGTVQEQYFYFPYGGIFSQSGSDPNHYKFTGKERDAESGLDNFTARYITSSMGRFMSPDPRGGHPEDPQTLNRYAYVRNNPTTLTDPTGLDFYLRCSVGDTSTCQEGHVGTTDDKGKFTATVVTSDSIREGKNSASVDQNGVEVTTGGKTYSGQYFDNPASHTTDAKGNDVNHNSVDLKGSGQFVGFSFNINGNCSGTCLASGSFSFNAPRDFTGNVLELRGSFRSIVDRRIPGWGKSLDEWEFHRGTEQYRFGTGPSPHFSLPDNPKDTVPTVGPFHVDKDAPGLKHLGCAKLGVGCQ